MSANALAPEEIEYDQAVREYNETIVATAGTGERGQRMVDAAHKRLWDAYRAIPNNLKPNTKQPPARSYRVRDDYDMGTAVGSITGMSGIGFS
jgi:hypothetical protein